MHKIVLKNVCFSLLIVPMLVSCANGANDTNNFTKEVNIYSLNDTHGDLIRDIDSASKGLDSISGLIKNDVKNNNKNSTNINICIGDMFQGQFVSEYTKGKAMVDALNYLNCKAFVIGNHEFDWTLEELHKFKDGDLENGELNCDFLGANIIETKTNKMPSWIKPYTIIEQDGHKIGIIGFMGEGIENTVNPGMLDGYKIVETLPLYNKYAKQLKDKDCDLILAAVHDYKDLYKEFARQDIPAQTIFGAHTHKFELEYIYNNKLSYGIPFTQAGCDNHGVAKLTYTFDGDQQLNKVRANLIKNNNPDDYLDSELSSMIKEKYADAINRGDEIIAKDFPLMNKAEWTRFIANILANDAQNPCNIGMLNYSSIRLETIHAPSNVLTVKQMRRVLPYENKILQVKIKKEIFDKYMEEDKLNYYVINSQDEENDYYIVNMIDFIFNLPEHRDVWAQASILKTFDLNLRDYVINYIQELR